MTTTENGAREIALPSVTELVLSSGVTVWVRPMSLNDQRLVIDEMNKRYPLPREADFQVLVPEDQATIPGQTMTDAEAYKQAVGAVGRERQIYFLRAHILTCLDFPEGIDLMVKRFLPEIQRKRKFLPLPEDDMEAVIYHAIIKLPEDEKLISAAITQTLPVSMSEVIDQLCIFRPAIEPRVDHPVHQQGKKPQRTELDDEQNGIVRDDAAV
jgi:hypothetical protein